MQPQEIKIQAAQDISELGYDEVIIVGANYETGIQHVTTYGKDNKSKINAAHGGNAIKKLLGWADENCAAQPNVQLFREEINAQIKGLADTNGVSDGYHTFGELYEHRIILYMALCSAHSYMAEDHGHLSDVWMTQVHSDGSVWNGWFVLGIGTDPGKQITYHLPTSKWDECTGFAKVIDKASDWDGHTSADVLDRISRML